MSIRKMMKSALNPNDFLLKYRRGWLVECSVFDANYQHEGYKPKKEGCSQGRSKET